MNKAALVSIIVQLDFHFDQNNHHILLLDHRSRFQRVLDHQLPTMLYSRYPNKQIFDNSPKKTSICKTTHRVNVD